MTLYKNKFIFCKKISFKKAIFFFFSLFLTKAYSQSYSESALEKAKNLPMKKPYEQIKSQSQLEPLKHDPWSLIIYRPENTSGLNEVRCWLKLEDVETGEDVTYTKAKAKYEWIPNTIIIKKKRPDLLKNFFKPNRLSTLYDYRKTYYLSGGMAMHLNLKKGKYKISVYTPKDHHAFFECSNKDDWISNEFYYDTDNPTNVIFVSPTANENGFYNGGWVITHKEADFYKFTKPKMEKN